MRPESSSSSTSSSSSRPRRRRWTRQQLAKTLQILGASQQPLLPQLPPSPPPSRSSSPAPGAKRKTMTTTTNSETESSKRARISPEHVSHRTESTSLPPQHHRVTPDSLPSSVSVPGPASQDLPPSSNSSPLLSAVPIRRPRRGSTSSADLDAIHTKYHNAGRLLKYSGDARFWSTYPPSHREYKPLANPPPPNSSYHKYGGIIARLELIDALVCFTYAMWAKDISKKSCNFDNWNTIHAFLSWCKSKWKAEEQRTEPELAFLGLIYMIESFIETRKAFFAAKMVATKMGQVLDKLTQTALTACSSLENGAGAKQLAGPQGTPPMLPSPASIGPSPSSRSTPSSHSSGTPSSHSRPQPARAPPPAHARPLPSAVMDAVAKRRGKPIPVEAYPALENITCALEPKVITEISQFTSHVANAGYGMSSAQESLSLGVMSRAFPHTFARMIHSTLTHGDELEPDFEDEEGELFWPGQCITGEGLGWVCLMGRAMVYEHGKNYGYQGLKAAVPKPDSSSR